MAKKTAEPTDLRIVKRAREIISDPAKWCKHRWAIAANGTPVAAASPAAARFCALGALHRAKIDIAKVDGIERTDWDVDQTRCLGQAVMDAGRDRGHWAIYIASLNDNGGHQAVLDIFDAAIAKMEKPKWKPNGR